MIRFLFWFSTIWLAVCVAVGVALTFVFVCMVLS